MNVHGGEPVSFTNKKVVVTGGANGIGKNIAKTFKAEGARVAVIDKDEVDYTIDLFFKGDLSKEDTLKEFSKQVIKEFKTIDYLINNACLSNNGLLSDCSFDAFNYVLKTGVTAPYMLTKLFLDHFNTDASVVNITSTRANMSQPDTESYSATKGGISALTHAMAVSLAGKVRVNSIAPGWIDTTNNNWSENDKNQHLVKRIGAVEDISTLVLFLCSDKSSFITGENITIDGGMSKLMIYNNDHGWSYEGD